MRRAFFPFLIAIHPVLASFAGPGKWEPLEDSIRPAIVLYCTFLLLWLVLSRWKRDAARAGFALSTFWFLFFAYGDVDFNASRGSFWVVCGCLILVAFIGALGTVKSRNGKFSVGFPLLTLVGTSLLAALAKPFLAPHAIYALLWIFVVLVFVAWASSVSYIERMIPSLNIIAIGLMILPLIETSSAVIEARKLEATLKAPTFPASNAKISGRQPDVYLFFLDAYGRSDALKRTFGYDNTPFVTALKNRGFFVASDSRSNYAQTEQSLSSELNGNYLSAIVPQVSPDSKNRSLFNNLVDDNAMAKAMESRGYQYVTISTGFPLINRDSDRKDLSDPPGLSLAEQLLLYRTPEAGLCLLSPYFHQVHRNRITNAFEEAATLPPSGQPRFVLVHILAPHPPFVFDASGNAITPKDRQFGLWDADGFVLGVGSGAEYFKLYPQQLQYVNKLVLQTVDRIQSHSKIKPVIILEGDHGSRKGHSMVDLADTDPTESFENLMAISAPPAVRKNLYDSITPVNVSRAVVSGLFGTPFQKLPDRSIYSSWNNPYRYTDVTNRVR